MVTSVTSLTGSGIRDWLVQRASAVLLGLYTLYLFYYFLTTPNIDFASWQALFAHPAMKVFSFLALLSLVFHSWVGIWIVSTDYIKCKVIRLSFHIIFILALIVFLAWGIAILWSV